MNIGMASAFTSSFDKDMFMKLLLTQLKNQNPEEPVSNAEMTSQISSLAMVEGMTNLNSSFGNVLKLQMLLSGTGLIGREVEYQHDGERLRGLVESIDTSGETVDLMVDGNEISVDQVMKIL